MTEYRFSEFRDAKDYLWLVPTHGVEMGFGAAGDYEAHAHRHFLDLMYAPGGIRSSPDSPSSQLLVVPPRTPFGPVSTDAFFFLKAVAVDEPVSIPDKVTGADLECVGAGEALLHASGVFDLALDYVDPRDRTAHLLSLASDGAALSLTSTAGWQLTIRP